MLKSRQLFDSDTYTYSYLIWDTDTRFAALIDSVQEHVHRDLQLIDELKLNLLYVLETHIHADHITGSGLLRKTTNAKVVVHKNSGSKCADILAEDGDAFFLGKHSIRVIHTPGHTNTDICYKIDDAVFTGDTLLIRGCGRTDFQSGSASQLYDSITQKLFTLPDDTEVFPGHDYNGITNSTIGEEKNYNPRIGGHRNKDAFIFVMDSLDLAPPEKIKQAVPGNLKCGL